MPDFSDTSLFYENFSYLLSRAPLADLYGVIQDLWLSQPSLFQTDQAAVCIAFTRHVKGEISLVRHNRQLFAPCTLASISNTVRSVHTAPQILTDIIDRRRGESMNIDEMSIQRALELCLRISLWVNVSSCNLAVGGMVCYERPLDWYSQESVQVLIKKAFQLKIDENRLPVVAKIEGMLTAEYLVNSCGIEIEWTNYLTDHLRLSPDGHVLLVFRHKAFLKDRVDRDGETLIPAEVLNEALDTLNLLFPFGDPATKQLLAKHGERDFYDLGACGRERVLGLSHFKHWRLELEALIDIYNSPPRTWRQLTLDRRNKLEWSAFWVTVMVAFLTLVSIPCSIILAVYYVKSYHLALAQGKGAGGDEL